MGAGNASRAGPRELLRTSSDLLVVVALVALTNLLAVLPAAADSPVRAAVGLVFVLFAPGYALVSALYPERQDPRPGPDGDAGPTLAGLAVPSRPRLDSFARVALGFGLSLAFVPIVLITVTYFGPAYPAVSAVGLVSLATLGCVAVAAIRRGRLPPERRFRVPVGRWVGRTGTFLSGGGSRPGAVLNVALVLAVLFSVGTLAFGVVASPDGEQFTGLSVLTETAEGELVADGYPDEFTLGESRPVVLGIENREEERTAYTVVVELQRVVREPDGNETRTRVLEADRLSTIRQTVGPGETWRQRYRVRPTMTGANLRLTFLLYRGDPPANPTIDDAYRELHLWVSVDAPPSDPGL